MKFVPQKLQRFVPHISKRTAAKIAGAFAAVTTVYASQNYAGPNQFALRETFGNVGEKTLPSGMYFHVPFAQYTHSYNKNVQMIEFNAGSCRFLPLCASTADQNTLTSKIALHYEVLQDPQKLGFFRWKMDGWKYPDGYWLLTEQLNHSANAVMGKKSMAEVLVNPQQYLSDLYQDFAFRLEQNNIPVKITSIELKGFSTFIPTHTVTYQLDKGAANAPIISPPKP
jgi:hypothetical protein